jgi:acyl-CoA synthetase (AMP-forming)/AMP-acid ligase II
MSKATTLTELLEDNRKTPRSITYFEGENDSREVSYGELYERALGILYHLQRIGARRGDKLILLLANNEQFLDAYWAPRVRG